VQRVLNAAARVVSGTRKFGRGLTQPVTLYKLCVMMHPCQNGMSATAQYLTAHWVPVSETTSTDSSYVILEEAIWWSSLRCRQHVDVAIVHIIMNASVLLECALRDGVRSWEMRECFPGCTAVPWFRISYFRVRTYQVRRDVTGDENVPSVGRHVPPVSTQRRLSIKHHVPFRYTKPHRL